jgi:capsule biosynthesis phosphatase
MPNNKDVLIIDLDDTLTVEDGVTNYAKKTVNRPIAIAVKNAVSLGYESKIFSARNMRSFKGNLNKIESITRPIAESWLKEKNIAYSELILGKPWCGYNGWYLDDKNISIEDFIFKFNGPYWDKTITILIPFYNEEGNIFSTHIEQKKIERLLNVVNYIYIDNGSSDGTLSELEKISSQDEKVKVLSIKKNIGYGYGIKKGLLEVSSDLVLLNHADLQFDAYSFFYTNSSSLLELNKPLSILPKRLNRSLLDRLNSSLLRVILSIIYLKKISDFNGQPKLISINHIKDISTLPDNFCIDLELYNLCRKESIILPIIQKGRVFGQSSWSGKFSIRVQIFLQYVTYALKNRK